MLKFTRGKTVNESLSPPLQTKVKRSNYQSPSKKNGTTLSLIEAEIGLECWNMKMKSETVTLVLVNLAGIMERTDEKLLPGVYKEVGAALNIDPTSLGSLTLFRSIVQSCFYPLAAFLALRHNRVHVIALGAFLWSAATILVALSSTFLQVFTLLSCLCLSF